VLEGAGVDLDFLAYLAKLGTSNLHPKGQVATTWLLEQLDLKAGMCVLELGCGTAETIVRILQDYPVKVDGLDVLEPMLRIAKLRLRLTLLQSRSKLYLGKMGASLPFPSASYSRVYTESVLGFQDAAASEALLAEIYRVLEPGGLYVANEAIWKKQVSQATVAEINQACLADFGLRQASRLAWSLADWVRLMEITGFEVLSAQDLNDYTAIAHTTSAASAKGWRLGAWRLLLSKGLSLICKIKALLNPSMLRQRTKYKQLLEKHRLDGQYIEAHLFVLKKANALKLV
jgi:ubiquinone/menaquinone biosynthesis C-methylase UbiE